MYNYLYMINYICNILDHANWKRAATIGGALGIVASLPLTASFVAIAGAAASSAILTGGTTFWHQRNLEIQTNKLLPTDRRTSAAFVRALPYHERNQFIELLNCAQFPDLHRKEAAGILQRVDPQMRNALIADLLIVNPDQRLDALRSLCWLQNNARSSVIYDLNTLNLPNISAKVVHTLAFMTSDQRSIFCARIGSIRDKLGQQISINHLFRVLDALSSYDEKIEFLDQYEALVREDMADITRKVMFESFAGFSVPERRSLCHEISFFGPHSKSFELFAVLSSLRQEDRHPSVINALRLDSLLKSSNHDDRVSLLKISVRIPPHEMEEFIGRAREMISCWTPNSSRIRILGTLSNLSPTERRSARSMIPFWMSSETRIALLRNLKDHPRLQEVQNRISFYMGGSRRMAILREIRNPGLLVPGREEGFINRIYRVFDQWRQRYAAPTAAQTIAIREFRAQAPISEDSWQPTYPGSGNFVVNLPYLQAFPFNVAVFLPLVRLQAGAFPPIRYADDNRGIDAGGITRDFVSRLFASLFDREQADRRLPLKSDAQGHFPLLEGTEQQKQKLLEVYQGIGWIYALAWQGHRQIATGVYVHPGFFDMIHSLESAELRDHPESIPSIHQIDSVVYKKLLKSYLKSNCRDRFGVATADREQLDRDIDAFVEHGTLNQYHREVVGIENANELELEQTKAKEIILAAINIAKSMHTTLGDTRWNQMKAQSAQTLNERIQGKLTKQLVLEAFGLNGAGPMGGRSLQQTWVHRYVTELGNGEADKEKLKQFVWAVSGRSSIVTGQAFTISPQQRTDGSFPEFHTCDSAIDIPTYNSYETFKSKLERAINEAVVTGGFGRV